jgi:hypothetical protein
MAQRFLRRIRAQRIQSTTPFRPGFDHAINLKPDAPPISPQKVISLPQHHHAELREFLDAHEASGCIRPSTSLYAASFFFVPKHDGRSRPTQDYHWLNAHTIRDKYLLPRIEDLIDWLRGSKHFSKMDVRWGFNNVRIREGDKWKAAFITEFGLYEPLVMFFGLCNSPSTFQRLMDKKFFNLIQQLWLEIYMDDSNVHTKDTVEHHRACVQTFLQ